ncbi:lycopene beta-cyclase CrtY [Fulvimarina sp. 2208YS6-2-32]|uniref:Lycopene beta-cyclase CrtY n=1 Tax=Fulvimarina uroteuthidis TaxID=3098149 RepID=A0ABU5HZ49_9HYPH|nr:lycopene beta-cyclase CrtY [Fulvimarina sp. 2208YS6-2-32]MDY8108406.1 lycopene beta-cyclase CrtY [Fulvimarina sp. 2208YS6-2-32]
MQASGYNQIDIALIGGGLANGLIAWRLAELRPDLKVVVFEAGDAPGGNHTWSFHEHDLTHAEHRWMAPFIVHRWSTNEVQFPDRYRQLSTGYLSASSDLFRDQLTGRLAGAIRTGRTVEGVTPTQVTLEGGETVAAGAVIDGRGYRASPHLNLGFQKFLGQEIEFEAPHGVVRPVIMDATVPQADGYRFVYLLPMSATRLLVEDTYYADGEALDRDVIRANIDAYRRDKGWPAGRVVREEDGVLPIALAGDIDAFWAQKGEVAASGLNAALFHPTTGYSLPDAVHLADRIAGLPEHSAAALFDATRRHSVETWKKRGFFRMLNRLLYLAGDPLKRYVILQHFYRLPEPLVSRFYAGDLTRADKVRILTGKPPVSVIGALKVLSPSSVEGAAA